MPRRVVGFAAFALTVLAAVSGAGCGRSGPGTPAHPGRKITRQEYRKMSPEEKDDPYTKAHLEQPPPAKKGGKR